MKNKVKALLLISLIGGFTFVGCLSLKKKEIPQKKVIAVSMIGETHDWPVGVAYYAEQEVKEVAQKNNWEYKFIISADTNEQSTQLIELVEKKVDCIVMLPMDGASLKTAVMIIKDARIPLVIFDREIPDFAPTATVKGDNKGIGIKTADLFNGYFPDGTKVLEFMGDTSTVPQQRTDGYDETISNHFKKEQVGYTGWQRKDSKELLQHWVRTHSEQEIDEVGAIFTHDDEIALGILDALDEYSIENRESKKFKSLKVIAGSAGSKEMYHRIQDEKQYILFSLTYSPTMIKKAIRIGEKIIKGEAYEEVTIIETGEVNKYNVLEYLNENSPY